MNLVDLISGFFSDPFRQQESFRNVQSARQRRNPQRDNLRGAYGSGITPPISQVYGEGSEDFFNSPFGRILRALSGYDTQMRYNQPPQAPVSNTMPDRSGYGGTGGMTGGF